MRNLGKLAALFFAFAIPGAAVASGHPLLEFKADTANLPAVQRGAATFMNYCSGCHSMKYLRYNRIGQDLQIPEDMLKSDLMFTSIKVGDTIVSSMPADAKGWFGQQPPDLSLETRARGPSWVYSYLKSFYVDPSRPMGVNNLQLPNASMPHILWELQGWQEKVEEAPAEGGKKEEGEGHKLPLELAQPGKMSPDDYDKFVGDLVNFMVYASEPGRSIRTGLGLKALIYLLVFTFFAYLLKKEYWRDVPH